MGPKKQIKKQVIEQPPKAQVPSIPIHELQGYAKFSYSSGSQYTGEWKLFRGIKMKHGKGALIVQKITSSKVGKQMYEGQWCEDCMQGQGTYYYPDGAVYTGSWKNNQHSGFGIYEFPNGTVYEGQWNHHLLHGTGYFIDHTGKKWQGEFRQGKFQTINQAQLLKEKALLLKKIEVKKQIDITLNSLLEAIAKSDKKTLKDNLSPFFAAGDTLKELVRQPYSKFDERPPQKWTEIINTAKSGTYKVLQSPSAASIIAPDRILVKQLQGRGQFVEVEGVKEQKIVKIGLVALDITRWVVVCVSEQDRKK